MCCLVLEKLKHPCPDLFLLDRLFKHIELGFLNFSCSTRTLTAIFLMSDSASLVKAIPPFFSWGRGIFNRQPLTVYALYPGS